jgi:ribosome-binding protein aMBF1 (putative translation factor)
MIELTDEMVTAFMRAYAEADDGSAKVILEDAAERAGLAAVLTIVERDRKALPPYLMVADVLTRLPVLLHTARTQRGLSVKDAAAEINLAPSTIHRVEHGKGCNLPTAVQVLFWLSLQRPDAALDKTPTGDPQ